MGGDCDSPLVKTAMRGGRELGRILCAAGYSGVVVRSADGGYPLQGSGCACKGWRRLLMRGDEEELEGADVRIELSLGGAGEGGDVLDV